jgi:hypothetical protein
MILSSNIIKPPSPQETEHEKKRKKEKAPSASLQIKGGVNILRGEKHFNFKNSF